MRYKESRLFLSIVGKKPKYACLNSEVISALLKAPEVKTVEFTNSVGLNEVMSCLIWINTVCPIVFDFII